MADSLAIGEELLSPATRIRFLSTVIRQAKGARFTDSEGRNFLDFHSMASVANVGHNHVRVVEAVQAQAQVLSCCNIAYGLHQPLLDLSQRIANLPPFADRDVRIAFGLSGSDANDGALKLARAATGRWRILSFEGAYHGTTFGALSLSAADLNMVRSFGPGVPGVHHVPFPDVYRMDGSPQEITQRCLGRIRDLFARVAPPEEFAAIFVEPVQGDSGVLVPPEHFLPQLAALCAEHGILLVADEVQSGLGRTGSWLACEQSSVQPDIVLLGKALGAGLPISAIVARSDLMDAWQAPGHVFGVGGNPISCAAAIEVLQILESEKLLENARERGAQLRAGLLELQARYDEIGDVRGGGLMMGVDLVTDRATKERNPDLAKRVLIGCYARSLFLTNLRGNVLRLIPPLVITESDVTEALTIIDQALEDALAGRVTGADTSDIVGWG